MRSKTNIFSIILTAALHFGVFQRLEAEQPAYQCKPQPPEINTILEKENKTTDLKRVIDIIIQIDDTYGDIYNYLSNGGKITIFFDPAHGKLENGKWDGEVTGRISCAGLPEEYYSIPISRKIFELLQKNKYIEVKSTDDYMYALMRDGDTYNNINFSETIRLANEMRAFIIISEHLNNISSLHKADGRINASGIHITIDEAGNSYLTYVNGVHKGFLTLFNKYDITGFSKNVANKVKAELSDNGVDLNSWQFGAVADDRFSYFTDFPLSIIFELGFISNPIEEKKLKDPEYQDILVKSQYNAIIESIRDIFGIDVSGYWLSKNKSDEENKKMLTIIKLSRIALFYLQNNNPEKCISVIETIRNSYEKNAKFNIERYIEIKNRIIKSEKYYKECLNLLKLKKYGTAKQKLLNALSLTNKEIIYTTLYEKYASFAKKYFNLKILDKKNSINIERMQFSIDAKKAAYNIPIIFAVENGQSLENAVEKALSPDIEFKDKIIDSFKNAYNQKRVKEKIFSKKTKKWITMWKWEKNRVNFNDGIYLVRMDKKFKITNVNRVYQIMLNPYMYQNQQYLKNSYFANRSKEKSL